MQGNKEVTISFANAVARENNRGSIATAQKAGRSASKACATKARATKARATKACTTRAKGKGRDKGKGRATEVIDNARTSARELTLGANQGTKRKRQVVDAEEGAGASELSGPRKLRKRV